MVWNEQNLKGERYVSQVMGGAMDDAIGLIERGRDSGGVFL
jgi:hypothetical protein